MCSGRFIFQLEMGDLKMILSYRDAMITVAVNSLTSFASGFVIFMFLVSGYRSKRVEVIWLYRVIWVKSPDGQSKT